MNQAKLSKEATSAGESPLMTPLYKNIIQSLSGFDRTIHFMRKYAWYSSFCKEKSTKFAACVLHWSGDKFNIFCVCMSKLTILCVVLQVADH